MSSSVRWRASAVEDALVEEGAGVPYHRYGADFRDGQGAINRPAYEHGLARWGARCRRA